MAVTAWIAWRVVKWVGVLLFAAGVLGGVMARDVEDRRRAVYAAATPGFIVAWVAGWNLLREAGVSMGSAWVSAGLVLSLVTLQAVVWGVERAGRPRVLVTAVALGSLLANVALMTARPGTKAAPSHGVEEAR